MKGSFNVCHYFMPKRNPQAALISISAGSLHIPTHYQCNGSGYNASKFAALKFFEILAAENPDLHVVSMHPGVGTCFLNRMDYESRLLTSHVLSGHRHVPERLHAPT